MGRPVTRGKFASRETLVAEIVRLRATRIKLDAVAYEVGVAISTVHRILRGNGL